MVNKLTNLLAQIIQQCIINFDPHPVLYFSVSGFCLIHTILCIMSQDSPVYSILRWLEPANILQPAIIVYSLLILTVMTAIGIILLIFWNIEGKPSKSTVFRHYLIKITMIMVLILSDGLLQTGINGAFKLSEKS